MQKHTQPGAPTRPSVVTWQSPGGATIDISPEQAALLAAHGVWPKDSQGRDYCQVSHGLHGGQPSLRTETLLQLCGVRDDRAVLVNPSRKAGAA